MTPHDPEDILGQFVYTPLVATFLGTLGGARFDRFADLEIREYADKGLAVYINRDRRVVSVFLYSARDESHASYAGVMPRHLSFADTAKEVADKIGRASASGRIKESGAPWDRCDFDTVSIHVQYRLDSKGIEMVTLMTPAMARGEV
jgi:hypothetical protein